MSKEKSDPEDVVAQQPVLLGLLDGHAQPLDRQGIFGARVDVALAGVDGLGGDNHALQHRMGVAPPECCGP